MRWEAPRFRPEDQEIAMVDRRASVGDGGVGAEGVQSGPRAQSFQKGIKALMVTNIHLLPVIQPCPLEMLVIGLESQRVDEVETQFRRAAKPGDVPRVGRNFGLVEDNVKARVFDDLHHTVS